MKTIGVALATVIASAATLAQAPAVPQEFPAGAQPLATEALRTRLADKVYGVKVASGTAWRLQFNANGFYYVNVSNGFTDNGKWRLEESRLCTAPQKSTASCNEMRLVGEVLYLKRDSGEVIKLDPN
ncbi:MAG: hypothetical protein V4792_01315 [Pseudomonadota bacterium]